MKRSFLVKMLRVTALLSIATMSLWAQELGYKAGWFKGDTITSSSPLEGVADIFQARYAKPITYEDPVWEWDGDAEFRGIEGNANWAGAKAWVPLRRVFHLPFELTETRQSTLSSALLESVLAEYHRQNPLAHFRVIQSRLGLHFVPDTSHNRSGQVAPALSAMDTTITVPEGNRTASAHFEAICEAISQRQGFRVLGMAVGIGEDWYENLFDAPGGKLTWGATAVTAREALVDLLDHSATSFSWRLLCEPSTLPHGVARCSMNLQPLHVVRPDANGNPVLVRLEYDRRSR